MSYNPNYIEVSPSDLVLFEDVPNKSSIAFVTIKNLTSRRVAYKIKTTSPKGYVVKPNSGVIFPKESKKIEFSMQATPYTPSTKNSQDKFMFMAIDLDDNFDVAKIADIWRDKPQEKVQQVKLQASFKGNNFLGLNTGSAGGRSPTKGGFDEGREVNLRNSNVGGGRSNNQLFQSALSPTNQSRGRMFTGEEGDDYLVNKVNEQERQIAKLTEERNQFFNEVVALKETLERNKGAKGNKGNYSSFQLWHMLVAAIISLLIGAFLSS
jgi:vesicle-associated membrane protein-associated protein B